jgi:RimJ/RimL family protein N-acetyltransferase
MSLVVRNASNLELSFAHDLTRDNMAPYYSAVGRIWDETLFRDSWTDTENFVLIVDERVIGVLRVSQGDDALIIRDIQLVETARGRGYGTAAIIEAERIASLRGIGRLRLSVFSDNPAARIYHRLGYREIGASGQIIQLEKRAA